MACSSRIAVLVSVLATSCADEPIDPELARTAFVRVNDVLHELHLDVLDTPPWPTANYESACAAGGDIVMRSEVDAQGAPVRLFHTFRTCSVDGWTFDGQLDYLDLTPCSGNSYTYVMSGQLEIGGIGACVIEAQQTCGADVGSSCGVEL